MLPSRRVNPSDLELLLAWRSGDPSAGEALFRRHFEAVVRFFCNKVGEDVDDLVQETFLGCLRSRERFREEASFRTFLFAIARNKLLAHRDRWRRAHADADFDASRVAALDASPSQIAVEQSEQELLVRGLRRIDLDLQIALELYYWEGLRSVDVAVVLDIPHGTARSRLRRGKEQLRTAIEALARSPELGASTTADLERWLRSIRGWVGPRQGPDPSPPEA